MAQKRAILGDNACLAILGFRFSEGYDEQWRSRYGLMGQLS
jgi:hypothetical protein